MASKLNDNQAAWNIFQGKMRILKKKQKQILTDFRNRLESQKISDIKNALK